MSSSRCEIVGDDRFGLMSQDSLSPAISPEREKRDPRCKRAGGKQWTLALLPLAAHFAMSVATAIFMWFYVSGRPFGIHERRASFVESDGTRGTLQHFTLLQTDITTLLSVVLAAIRACAGCWCAAMCSRYAFLLLEKDGISKTSHGCLTGVYQPLSRLNGTAAALVSF